MYSFKYDIHNKEKRW